MTIHINPNIPGRAVCVDENGRELHDITPESMNESLSAAMAHQSKCEKDAIECLRFYFNEDDVINLEFLENWLAKNQPLDRWFYVHLIELAGERFLHRSYSANCAEMASLKNAKPRAWVLSEWNKRTDPEQGKAAFARQFAPLVKKQFDLIVNPETIARDWLPKVKK